MEKEFNRASFLKLNIVFTSKSQLIIIRDSAKGLTMALKNNFKIIWGGYSSII
jgi:hypothetical protein